MVDHNSKTLQSPKRRWMMKAALAIGAVGATLGGSVFWHRGIADGHLTSHGADVLRGLARGILGPLLPPPGPARNAMLNTHVKQLDAFLGGLPAALRLEIGALLGLLANPPTRLLATGLSDNWAQASDADIATALESMRLHALPSTQMAYHAVRDITCTVFFSSSDNWKLAGYPGPMDL